MQAKPLFQRLKETGIREGEPQRSRRGTAEKLDRFMEDIHQNPSKYVPKGITIIADDISGINRRGVYGFNNSTIYAEVGFSNSCKVKAIVPPVSRESVEGEFLEAISR